MMIYAIGIAGGSALGLLAATATEAPVETATFAAVCGLVAKEIVGVVRGKVAGRGGECAVRQHDIKMVERIATLEAHHHNTTERLSEISEKIDLLLQRN